MITSVGLAERMKKDILADVIAGVVPATVRSFSELHDFVDANLYGGTEELLDELNAGSATDDEHSTALSALCDLCNPAMDSVDAWIKAGGVADALQEHETSAN